MIPDWWRAESGLFGLLASRRIIGATRAIFRFLPVLAVGFLKRIASQLASCCRITVTWQHTRRRLKERMHWYSGLVARRITVTPDYSGLAARRIRIICGLVAGRIRLIILVTGHVIPKASAQASVFARLSHGHAIRPSAHSDSHRSI